MIQFDYGNGASFNSDDPVAERLALIIRSANVPSSFGRSKPTKTEAALASILLELQNKKYDEEQKNKEYQEYLRLKQKYGNNN